MLLASSLTLLCCRYSAASVADVPSSWPPSAEPAEEVPVVPRPERFAVFRARFRGPLPLVSGVVGGFSDDVSELLPGDGCSPPSDSAAAASSAGGKLGPPWRVIFGMLSSLMTPLACTPAAAAAPCSACRSDPQ
jgi:hypothetical protein